MTTLEHKDGQVHVETLPTGRHRVLVKMTNPAVYASLSSCETAYPLGLIENILKAKGPGWLCEDILREESPDDVQSMLTFDLLSYLDKEEFNQVRVLDFGCGTGASTMVLARMFPGAEIVGIELEERLLSIARLRAAHYGYKNITLLHSLSPLELPEGIGRFRHVVLSAVYEHLLPGERGALLRRIWDILEPRGVLFLNQTPYRYFPIEHHTTGLPLINYLPDRLTLWCVRRFSRRKLRDLGWPELLRAGVRGGTVGEILKLLGPSSHARVLAPSRLGVKDRIDLWYAQSRGVRLAKVKGLFRSATKLLQWLSGVTLVPSLALAVRKET